MSRGECHRYWREVHAEIAKGMPGVRRYIVNLATRGAAAGEEPPFDGVAELWFAEPGARPGQGDEEGGGAAAGGQVAEHVLHCPARIHLPTQILVRQPRGGSLQSLPKIPIAGYDLLPGGRHG